MVALESIQASSLSWMKWNTTLDADCSWSLAIVDAIANNAAVGSDVAGEVDCQAEAFKPTVYRAELFGEWEAQRVDCQSGRGTGFGLLGRWALVRRWLVSFRAYFAATLCLGWWPPKGR